MMASSAAGAARGSAARCAALMTAAGGLGHTLPYLIPDFRVATGIACAVVVVELAAISLDPPPFHGIAVAVGRLAGGLGRRSGVPDRRPDRLLLGPSGSFHPGTIRVPEHHGPTQDSSQIAPPGAEPGLYNADLAPVPADRRRWGVGSFAALWISMSACIPTYMLASSLIGGGMNWWEAILTIFLGNLVVLVPMILNAHAGTRYGIPFPVYCRAAFGTSGANLPALLRAFVACGWFGIQTWIGGDAIYRIVTVFAPDWPAAALTLPGDYPGAVPVLPPLLGDQHAGRVQGHRFDPPAAEHQGAAADRAGAVCSSPGLTAHAGGFGPMLSQPSAFDAGQPKGGQFFAFFGLALTGHGRLLGDAFPQHPGLFPLRAPPAGPDRWARRWGCRSRWRSIRSSASR